MRKKSGETMTEYQSFILDTVAKKSPYVAQQLQKELNRQHRTIELIASENYCSEAEMAAAGSWAAWKYTEGYPPVRPTGNKGRYYGGTEVFDAVEQYACEKWLEAFDAKENYHVNVQLSDGSSANLAAYMAVLQPGDTVLSMDLNHGAHLTHGSPVNFSGKLYKMEFYTTDSAGYIDMDDVRRKALACRPKAIICGASAYPRVIPFDRFREIADEVGAYLICDTSHISGLIVSGDHPSPFAAGADIVTTTTHKTLRSERGAMIFCRKELAKKIDSAVFPGTQGGSLMNMVFAKAIGAELACGAEYREYIHRVVKNCRAMAEKFTALGMNLVTGGTDNHLLLIDLPASGADISGKAVQDALDSVHITLNKNCVPDEKRSPMQTSGVRVGTAAMTTRGFSADDFRETAQIVTDAIRSLAVGGFDAYADSYRDRVAALIAHCNDVV